MKPEVIPTTTAVAITYPRLDAEITFSERFDSKPPGKISER